MRGGMAYDTLQFYSWTVKGLAISSEPSTGLTMVIRGPLTTTSPNDRVCGSGSVCVMQYVCFMSFVKGRRLIFFFTFTLDIFFNVIEDEI